MSWLSTKDKIWKDEWRSASTPNQKTAIPVIIAKETDIIIKATNPDKIRNIERALGITLDKGKFTIKPGDIGSFDIIGSKADDYTSVKNVVDLTIPPPN